MCRSGRAVFCTVTSDTQTGLDCWCRILSFRLSYQTLEPGCRSIRAGGKHKEKNILQIGTSTQTKKKKKLHVYHLIFWLISMCRYLRRGDCSVSSAWGPVSKGVWSSCWSWGCTSASWPWRLCGCAGPRTGPSGGTGCSWAFPLQ